MVEVKNITKIYGRGKKKVVALDDVSFVLPDSGMVFVVGKSGCGKSTLLNMIGGCDKLTAGDIIMDGNAFSSFRERDYDDFRNDYVGFIFQDYCLLEGLTVMQNVSLALELKGECDDEAVMDALVKVKLSDCTDRYPDELSGGQKQRVAIARTLVKKPQLILADEPTGNLDGKSSTIILDILKELSATTLVVIVSHNRPDAEKYADRIIELSDGKIVGDISRNPAAEDISFDGRDIVIQRGTVFSDAQLDSINERLREGGVRLRQADEKFLPTVSPLASGQKQRFSSHRMRFRGKSMLFWMFAKKRAIGTAVTALSIVFLIVVIGICQLFTKFSPDAEIERLLAQEDAADAFIVQKGYKAGELSTAISSDVMVRVDDADIAAFRNTGYEGGIYPLYNASILSHTGKGAVWSIEGFKFPADKTNYATFYCHSALGVLVTDKDFLSRIYGDENGKLTLLSGTLETEGDALVITDYFADSILAYNRNLLSSTDDPYQKLTTGKPFFSRYRIAGVIATGYLERYKDMIHAILGGNIKNIDPEAYADLLAELNSTLNIAYSFNPGYMQAYSTDSDLTREIYLGTMSVTDGVHSAETTSYARYSSKLKPGEVLMRRAFYASLMGIEEQDIVESEAIGTKLTLTRYERIRQGEPADYTAEVTIAGLTDNENTGAFYFGAQEYRQAAPYAAIPYALYFDDLSNVTELYDAGREMNYVIRSPLVTAIYTVARAAVVFKDMFKFIVGIMLFIIAITLIAFGVGSVRKNMYEIAVVRALGGKTGDLAGMFLLQMFLVSLIVCILSVGGLAVGAIMCNGLLQEGFVLFAKNAIMSNLRIVTFDWVTALMDAAVVLILTVIAAVAPFIIMRRAKPREIIRAKE